MNPQFVRIDRISQTLNRDCRFYNVSWVPDEKLGLMGVGLRKVSYKAQTDILPEAVGLMVAQSTLPPELRRILLFFLILRDNRKFAGYKWLSLSTETRSLRELFRRQIGSIITSIWNPTRLFLSYFTSKQINFNFKELQLNKEVTLIRKLTCSDDASQQNHVIQIQNLWSLLLTRA